MSGLVKIYSSRVRISQQPLLRMPPQSIYQKCSFFDDTFRNLSTFKKKETLRAIKGRFKDLKRTIPPGYGKHMYLLLGELGLVPYEPYTRGRRCLLDEWLISHTALLRRIGKEIVMYADAERRVEELKKEVWREAQELRVSEELKRILHSGLNYIEKGMLYAFLKFFLFYKEERPGLFAEIVKGLGAIKDIYQLKQKIKYLWHILQSKILVDLCIMPLEDAEPILKTALYRSEFGYLSSLDFASKLYDPSYFSEIKKAIRESWGEIVVWVHPGYALDYIFDKEGKLINEAPKMFYQTEVSFIDYGNYLERISHFLKFNTSPIFCFVEAGKIKQLKDQLKGIDLEAPIIIGFTDKGTPKPIITSEREEDPWIFFNRLLDRLGVIDISFIGELGYKEGEEEMGGVYKGRKNLSSFKGQIKEELIFPNIYVMPHSRR